ncbi:hypothetical protein E0Z10_g7972 [Xylaria hypoxylon]|uniref:Uncharacterized protein n=1 Tax=Xylaria hypoxylon TaxID=37992 RepID=A0A4Z0YKX7_9PEZI|nr:hypothetical protein E0Z10_g7972 [Xylaria hypoxylon]
MTSPSPATPATAALELNPATPSEGMDASLQQVIDDIRREPHAVDEDIQFLFIKAVDATDDAHAEIVDILSCSVDNLHPRLALRLSLWYIHHQHTSEALNILSKVLGCDTDESDTDESDADESYTDNSETDESDDDDPTRMDIIANMSALLHALEDIDKRVNGEEEDEDEDEDEGEEGEENTEEVN